MNQEMASITHFTYGDVLKSVPNNISYYLFKEDSLWRRESFTHDISEYQEFQFDSMNQREWTMFLNNIKSRIGDTTMMDITVHKYSKSYPRIDDFNGGYGFSLYKDYEEASLVIDTILYRGYFEYKSY